MCEGTKTLRLFQLGWNTTVLYKIMLHAHFSQIRVYIDRYRQDSQNPYIVQTGNTSEMPRWGDYYSSEPLIAFKLFLSS